MTGEDVTEAIRYLGERINEYAERYPDVWARRLANRERESEVERWGDDDSGGVIMAEAES